MTRALFDKTKYTKWYITDSGDILSKTSYHSDNTLNKIRPNINKNRGYLYARTSNKNYQIHRLVASAFIPNPDNKPQVNHIDGNKLNNHVSNLEWVTSLENIRHSINNGSTKQMSKNEGNIKYTNMQCREVLDLVNKGISYTKAGSIHNMPYSTVAHLVRGSRRKI